MAWLHLTNWRYGWWDTLGPEYALIDDLVAGRSPSWGIKKVYNCLHLSPAICRHIADPGDLKVAEKCDSILHHRRSKAGFSVCHMNEHVPRIDGLQYSPCQDWLTSCANHLEWLFKPPIGITDLECMESTGLNPHAEIEIRKLYQFSNPYGRVNIARFTCVTVIFLPLGFTASIFSLSGSSETSLAINMVVASTGCHNFRVIKRQSLRGRCGGRIQQVS